MIPSVTRLLSITILLSAIAGALLCCTTSQALGDQNGRSIVSINMYGSNSGWALAETSNAVSVLVTSDGGKTWSDRSAPSIIHPSADQTDFNSDVDDSNISLTSIDSDVAWLAISDEPSINGRYEEYITVFRTVDRGEHWEQSRFAVDPQGDSVQAYFYSRGVGCVVVGGSLSQTDSNAWIYETADGGVTWSLISESSDSRDAYDPLNHPKNSKTVASYTTNIIPRGIAFQADSQMWLYGQIDPTSEDATPFYKTVDEGQSWQNVKLTKPYDGFKFGNVYAPIFSRDSSASGTLIASGGTVYTAQTLIYNTRDGGESWTPAPAINCVDSSLFAIAFVTPAEGWILNEDGSKLYHTANGGHTWNIIALQLGLYDQDFDQTFGLSTRNRRSLLQRLPLAVQQSYSR